MKQTAVLCYMTAVLIHIYTMVYRFTGGDHVHVMASLCLNDRQTCPEVILLGYVPFSSQTWLVSKSPVPIYSIWTMKSDYN